MKDRNKYHRNYMKKRYHQRRKLAIKLLGGKCIKCNSKKRLEVDHKNKKKKTMKFDRMAGVSMKRFLNELKICQLLCKKCHQKKTIIERGNKIAKGKHGKISSYRYCKCKLCKKAKRDWFREYRKKLKGDIA